MFQKHALPKKSENNRWDTGKCLSRKFNDPYDLARFGILVQINGTSTPIGVAITSVITMIYSVLTIFPAMPTVPFLALVTVVRNSRLTLPIPLTVTSTDDHQKNRNCYGC